MKLKNIFIEAGELQMDEDFTRPAAIAWNPAEAAKIIEDGETAFGSGEFFEEVRQLLINSGFFSEEA